jgi:hypothetical protein
VIRTHVTVSVSVCCVLFPVDPVSSAGDAGRRDGVGHVVYEWRGLVERERRAEIGSRFFRRHIQSNGSSVMVLADSLVKFEGPTAVELEHGSVRVTTSHGLAAQAGDVTVKPAANSWTEFQVTDVDGRVQIAANKGDLTVQDDKGTTTVAQGQQTTRDDTTDADKKKKKRRKPGAATAASGGVMSSAPVVYGGLAVVGGAAIWIWTRDEGALSPSCPSNPCQ